MLTRSFSDLSDDEIGSADRFLVEAASALGKFGEGDTFHDPNDSIARLFHHRTDGAAGFIRAGTFFVEVVADATDRGERAFDVANDFGKLYSFRGAAKPVTASDPAFALNDACGLEVVEDLFEKTLRNILSFGDFLDANNGVVVLIVSSENEEGAERIFATDRKFHIEIKLIPSSTIKIDLAKWRHEWAEIAHTNINLLT